jgi:hypothetical protein
LEDKRQKAEKSLLSSRNETLKKKLEKWGEYPGFYVIFLDLI